MHIYTHVCVCMYACLRQCLFVTDHCFNAHQPCRERRAEADSNQGLSAYQTVLPLGQTGSPRVFRTNDEGLSLLHQFVNLSGEKKRKKEEEKKKPKAVKNKESVPTKRRRDMPCIENTTICVSAEMSSSWFLMKKMWYEPTCKVITGSGLQCRHATRHRRLVSHY